jgi:hypothetical protein
MRKKNKMAQKKETKNIKIRDLKPSKDAKGGFIIYGGPSQGPAPSRPSGGPSRSGWSSN